MKRTGVLIVVKSLLILLLFMQALVKVQEGNLSGQGEAASKTSPGWYIQPWIWVLGAATFLVILVTSVRGTRNRTADVSRSTTVIRADLN